MEVSNRKLGKRPPRIDAGGPGGSSRTFRLAKYLSASIPPPPGDANFVDKVTSWPMMKNDVVGDCTFAAGGHTIQQLTTYAQRVPTVPTDAQIIAGYSALTGYVPGDDSTDNGAAMLDVLNYWRNVGIAGHQILAYMQIDQTKPLQVKQSIAYFGNCYLGVALPNTIQNPPTNPEDGNPLWDLPAGSPTGDGAPASWGLHCVDAVSYGPEGIEVISWGQACDVTWRFIQTYFDEGYAVLSKDWIESTGLAPSHFNLSQLQEDLAAL